MEDNNMENFDWANLGQEDKGEKSEFEKIREANIRAQEKIKKELNLMDIKRHMEEDAMLKKVQKPKRKQLTAEQMEQKRLEREEASLIAANRPKRTTRSSLSSKLLNANDNIDKLRSSRRRKNDVRLKRPGFRSQLHSIDWQLFAGRKDPTELPIFENTGVALLLYVEARYAEVTHKSSRVPHKILPVESVTESMLQNVLKPGQPKILDSVRGTSCHECRQKSQDQKTCCRNPQCVGVQGQFCGLCLLQRYGECVKAALLDPDWWCMKCRAICICSFCRKKNGLSPTGILYPKARSLGYKSVWHMLEDKRRGSKFRPKYMLLTSPVCKCCKPEVEDEMDTSNLENLSTSSMSEAELVDVMSKPEKPWKPEDQCTRCLSADHAAAKYCYLNPIVLVKKVDVQVSIIPEHMAKTSKKVTVTSAHSIPQRSRKRPRPYSPSDFAVSRKLRKKH